MRLFGLIGYPLAQSFSKKYFDEKFSREGMTDCVFNNYPIDTITAFPKLLNEHPSSKAWRLPFLTNRQC